MIGFRHPMQGQCVPVPVCYVSPPTSDCQELLGIQYNRLILIDLHSLEHKKTWRYSIPCGPGTSTGNQSSSESTTKTRNSSSSLSADLKDENPSMKTRENWI